MRARFARGVNTAKKEKNAMFNLNPNKYTILDGAMGTMLQKEGLDIGEIPEILSVTNPALIEKIHRSYIKSGAQIVYSNTFGANSVKLAHSGYKTEEIIKASLMAARRACDGTNASVALDIGPLGELLEPSGTMSFERAYELFSEIVIAGKDMADAVVIETMTDLYEVKAAVLAVKENCSLPLFVSMSYEENGRTFTGCSIEAMAAVLDGLGVDAIGINCSLGPAEIFPLAKRLCECAKTNVFIKPNAGLPDPADGHYSIDANEFCEIIKKYADIGVCMIGGCCGTSPEYIKKLSDTFNDKSVKKRTPVKKSIICSPVKTVSADKVAVIGERINPTGKKLMKQALLENNIDYILSQAVEQTDAGADILDVNVGTPGIDEVKVLPEAVKKIQSVTSLPLQIDSSNPDAIEAALRVYNGKAIVNSVNGEKSSYERILPIVKKYGAAVVALTLDENGIPDTAQKRVEIAKRIIKAAEDAGIEKEDVYIDCLTLTASAQQAEVIETLRAVSMVKQLGQKTVLGVSNISFGLPERGLLNSTFLALALGAGLDMPIINPNTEAMMNTVRAWRVLGNIDKNSEEYVKYFSSKDQKTPQMPTKSEHTLREAVIKGLCDEAKKLCYDMLKDHQPLYIVDNYLIPALDTVGAEFEIGKMFLPQLLSAANAAQSAFDAVKEKLASSGNAGVSKGKIVLATVKGDIHDIGKNIVKVILENYGYTVIDLGRDVPAENVVRVAKENDVPLVGLSALMTTTLLSMADTIKSIRQAGLKCKIMVGGAVLTESYAKTIGADFYAKDAKKSADIAKEVIG